MEKNIKINDIAKETLTVLDNFEPSLLMKVPERIINYLKELAEESKKTFQIDSSKKLANQKISEGTKDLISYIYYKYIASEEEKQKILKTWDKNEIAYIKKLQEKYNYDNLLKANTKYNMIQNPTPINNTNSEMIEYKQSVFVRFKNFIKGLFKR